MVDIKEADQELVQRFLDQMINQWVTPEVEKRKKEGTIPEDFVLTASQVIFFPKPGKVEVKLNSEVKGILAVKVNRAIQKGEAVYDRDLDEIKSVDVSKFYPDAGHITALFSPQRVISAFDFRYNKSKIKEILNAANEFYQIAYESLQKKHLRPFFDNAFSCAELCATGILLIVPDKLLLTKEGGHSHRHKRLIGWTRLGNSKPEYLSLFEKLKECRPSARYLEGDQFQKENPEDIINVLKEMLDFAKEKIL